MLSSDILLPGNRVQDNRILESYENFSSLGWDEATRRMSAHDSQRCLSVDQRRTWSPVSLEQAVFESEVVDLSYMKHFRSNDDIDKISQNPPVITPVSGKLPTDVEATSSILRPVAFKPVILSSARRQIIHQHSETAISYETHSPSDSGVVVDLENLLRERESEILQLRKTMALNETAILKVYEEKSEHWQKRLESERSEWQSRLQEINKRAKKIEENLLTEINSLKDSNKLLLKENHFLKSTVNGLKNELNAKTCDLVQFSNDQSVQDDSTGSLNATTVDFQCQVNMEEENFIELKREFERIKNLFDRERRQWVAEKRQVVRYHKCLEMNYKQIQRKNEELTEELAQLAVELENRDLQLLGNAV